MPFLPPNQQRQSTEDKSKHSQYTTKLSACYNSVFCSWHPTSGNLWLHSVSSQFIPLLLSLLCNRTFGISCTGLLHTGCHSVIQSIVQKHQQNHYIHLAFNNFLPQNWIFLSHTCIYVKEINFLLTRYVFLLLLLLLHPLNGSLSGTTRVSQYQKGKTNLDLLQQETVSNSGTSWAICKYAPHPRQKTMPAPTTLCITRKPIANAK